MRPRLPAPSLFEMTGFRAFSMVPEKAMVCPLICWATACAALRATPKKWFRTMPTPYSDSMLLAETREIPARKASHFPENAAFPVTPRRNHALRIVPAAINKHGRHGKDGNPGHQHPVQNQLVRQHMNDKQGRPQLQERFQNAYDGEIQHIFMGVQHGFTGNAQNAEHGAGDHGPVYAPGGKTRSSGILRTCPNRMGAAAYSRIPTITAMARWSTTLILNTIFCFSGSPSPSA